VPADSHEANCIFNKNLILISCPELQENTFLAKIAGDVGEWCLLYVILLNFGFKTLWLLGSQLFIQMA